MAARLKSGAEGPPETAKIKPSREASNFGYGGEEKNLLRGDDQSNKLQGKGMECRSEEEEDEGEAQPSNNNNLIIINK